MSSRPEDVTYKDNTNCSIDGYSKVMLHCSRAEIARRLWCEVKRIWTITTAKTKVAERRNYHYEVELEIMAGKSSVQPECMVGTSTENKWNSETKSSTKESDPTPWQLLLKENVCLPKSKT